MHRVIILFFCRQVFCRELGYEHGMAYEHFAYSWYYDSSPYWTTNVNCAGTEQRLRDCNMEMGHVHQCNSGRGAGVLCTSNEGWIHGPILNVSVYVRVM
jgi:hypothetical protein